MSSARYAEEVRKSRAQPRFLLACSVAALRYASSASGVPSQCAMYDEASSERCGNRSGAKEVLCIGDRPARRNAFVDVGGVKSRYGKGTRQRLP